MNLTPITTTPEPTYRPTPPAWKKVAAAVAASAALWLPACGLVDGCPSRMAGNVARRWCMARSTKLDRAHQRDASRGVDQERKGDEVLTCPISP